MDGLKVFGAAVAGYALATVAAFALTRGNGGGGGNVRRRCGRLYIVVPPQDGAPRKAEAFDWRKGGNEPEGNGGAESANEGEG